MKRTVVICLFLCGLAATAMAQTTYEMLNQADSEYKSADTELNSAYKALVATLTPAQKESIKLAQRAWIDYRDTCVISETALYAGGSIEGLVAVNVKTAITLEQVALLKQLLSTPSENDKAAKSSSCDAAEGEMKKVYRAANAEDGTLEKAQTAWAKYRDLFLDVVTEIKGDTEKAGYCTKLTAMRTARLKELFPEGYPGDAGQTQVESDSDSTMTEQNGNNALLLAVKEGDWDAVEKALKEGADVNQAEIEGGATALHHAAGKGNVEIIRLLIKNGADVNAPTDDGLSPLAIAVLVSDNTSVAQVLVEAKADVNAYDEGGETILDFAIEKGHTKVAAFLESKGAERGEEPALTEEEMKNLPPATPSSEPAKPASPSSADKFVFKGFYIGMTINEGNRIIDEQYPKLKDTGIIHLSEGRDGKIFKFTFHSVAVDAMFNTEGMPFEDFVQAFVNGYSKYVPTMETFHDTTGGEFRSGYRYTNTKFGFVVEIDSKKTLTISRSAKESETSFN